jgi:hypothetical protein
MTPEQQQVWQALQQPTADQRARMMLQIIREYTGPITIEPAEMDQLILQRWLKKNK